VTISSEKKNAVLRRMHELGISENDIDESFVLGSGKGGQKVNKTASCVVLKYEPYGIVVQCQKDRSRDVNRVLARRLLCDKVEEAKTGKVAKRDAEIQRKRNQKKRRKRRSTEKYGADGDT